MKPKDFKMKRYRERKANFIPTPPIFTPEQIEYMKQIAEPFTTQMKEKLKLSEAFTKRLLGPIKGSG